MAETIRNPVEWSAGQLRQAAANMGSAGRAFAHVPETLHSAPPSVRRIGLTDIWEALARGVQDFGACRSDVIFLCAFYPLAGLVLGRVVFGSGMIQMVFPLVAGFALLGPFAAVGLLEMSRRRERGEETSWATAFAVVRAPSFPAIVLMGLLLLAIFLLWLGAAALIYRLTLGPAIPLSLDDFASKAFTTSAGRTMIVVGVAVGALFAALALTISVVSFAVLLDRDAGIDTAIATSMRVIGKNPGPMAAWGTIAAVGLAIGSLPLLLGLAFVFPILGHATWHLYRKVVTPNERNASFN
jgi:uncharacterized membrane protein